jgi:predicted dehydrogenase
MRARGNRRQFLKASAGTTFGVWLSPRPTFAQPKSPNEKLNVAVIGCGGQGRANIKGVKSENVVALCDIDDQTLGKAAEEFPGAKTCNDWRKLLDDHKSFDAVVISTPDHNHVHPTLAALSLGKHVYCEKPLTHTVEEGRLVIAAARKARVATQMGTQIHALDNYRRVVELLRSGAIGTVKRIHVWVPTDWHAVATPTDTPPVPPHIHWDLWLGPAPERPYHPEYHPFKWRRWWDFSNGALGDMACHHIDLSHWAFDLRFPETVEAQGPDLNPDSPPPWIIVHYRYAARGNNPPIHLTWYHGEKRPPLVAEKKAPRNYNAGTIFEGDKGTLIADYTKHALLPEDQFKDFPRPPQSIPSSIGHQAEWIKAAWEGTPTTCNFDYSGPLSQTVLLGCVSYKAKAPLRWDDSRGTTGVAAADRFLAKQYRRDWALPRV